MNLLYFKYAVEVAACGSINKAAEKLYIGQPNLSRAIKELEASLGVAVFERSAKGMEVTSDGEVFLKYAESILGQVDAVENLFKRDSVKKKQFSISVPRASYISEAFTVFSLQLMSEKKVEVFYRETNTMGAIESILRDDYRLAIIRYPEIHDKFYKKMLEEKGLGYELISEFRYVLAMSKESPLAKLDVIKEENLSDYIEIAHADLSMPVIPFSEIRKEQPVYNDRQIFVYERGSQLELLSKNKNTFMWVSPTPQTLLDRYGLVQKAGNDSDGLFKDTMVYRNDYKLTELDKSFISELCRVKREVFLKSPEKRS